MKKTDATGKNILETIKESESNLTDEYILISAHLGPKRSIIFMSVESINPGILQSATEWLYQTTIFIANEESPDLFLRRE
jgi:hypothetical protein